MKRFLLMLNTASKWFIQEILLLALATVFALSSMQLFMMLEYLRLEYATVNASLSGDTYWLFPSMRIENIVSEEYMQHGHSAVDEQIIDAVREKFGADVGIGRMMQTYGSTSTGEELQILCYDSDMIDALNMNMAQGEWLNSGYYGSGVPIVIRGSMASHYALGDIIDIEMTNMAGDINMGVVHGYAHGILPDGAMIFTPNNVGSEPRLDYIVTRDAVMTFDVAEHGELGAAILNMDMLEMDRLPISASMAIFAEDSKEDYVDMGFGAAWSVNGIISNTKDDFFAIYNDELMTALALMLCAMAVICCYTALWHYKSDGTIGIYEAFGYTRGRALALCDMLVCGIVSLGVLLAFTMADKVYFSVYYSAVRNINVYICVIASAALLCAISALINRFISDKTRFVSAAR
ncbi:MAG: hypothetical protein ACOYIH_10865 [Candidatus Fimadaptatus sp.]